MRNAILLMVMMTTGTLLACDGDEGAADAGAIDAGTDAGASDAGTDAGASDAGADAGALDAGTDAGASCIDEGHAAGERFPAGDGCNFCDCNADGSRTCTSRTCFESIPGCTYDGVEHGYGERFPSTDGCNECVCAASGLACTRRACTGAVPEGAVLLESMDAACGDNPEFTPQAVLEGLPRPTLTAPFLYERERDFEPETLADTTLSLRLVYDGGFLVCRLPQPDQAALDIEIVVEWVTADGAFDEGFPAYLRRNDFGFVDAWSFNAGAPYGALNGSYTPPCAIDPRDYAFSGQIEPDGHATGRASRVCSSDIVLDIGTFEAPPL